ncbi:hypothetical protein [Exiguobacterium sp. s162]|uniref:hypothetical protein n=1 Tax=Exiguobacterium sp. s162 TaxID=2751276 RepID=UPI001BED213B|nr:hypothetical protein [Exiguobacterium sp. s162]
MAKKKQFVTAAAAFAVAASAVAPAITADAASSTVRLSSDYVRGGDLDAALDKEYKGSEIYWYKSSIDMNKLGVFQTAKGFVKGKGIKVEKKLRVLNYAQEVKPAKEIVLEQGVPASGLRIQPVLFADGNLYDKPVSVEGFNTDKVGEFEGSFTYANKAFGSVTTKVKYKVVASKVAFSEVKHEVEGDMLSVSADVKNLKDGEKVELVIFPGKDESAALPAIEAEIKDGKVMASAKDIPAGTHSFILRSGDVKTAAMEFKVEKLEISSLKAVSAKSLEVAFNKAIDDSKVKFEVYKGSVKVNFEPKVVYNEAKTSATIELTGKLTAGEYTVKASGLSTEALSKSVVVENERVDKVEILNDLAIKDATLNQVKVGYKVVNQYGEDITSTTQIVANAGGVSVVSGTTASNGVVTIPVTAEAKENDSIILTLVHQATGKSDSKTVKVSAKSQVTDLAIKSVYNKDGKALTETTDLSKDAFYVIVEAKDQYGADASLAALNASNAVLINNTNKLIVDNSTTFETIKVDGKEVTALKLTGTPAAGMTNLMLISTASGKNASFTVNVAEAQRTDAVTFEVPSLVVAKERLFVPIQVTDKEGKVVTDEKVVTDAVRGIKVSGVSGAVVKVVDGKLGIEVAANNAALNAEGFISLVAVSSTGKSAIANIQVRKAAEPIRVDGVSSDIETTLLVNDTETITSADVKIIDQYEREMTADQKTALFTGGTPAYSLVLSEETANGGAISLANGVVTGSAKGTEKVTIAIKKASDANPLSGSAKSISFRVTDGSEYASYEVKSLGTVYDEVGAGKTDAEAYDKAVEVYGVLADGGKVKLSLGDYTVSSTNVALNTDVSDGKLDIVGAGNPLATQFNYGSASEIKLPVTVTINATGEKLSQEVTISKVAPKPVEVKVLAEGTNNSTSKVDYVGEVADTTLPAFGMTELEALVDIKVTDQYGVSTTSGSFTDGTSFLRKLTFTKGTGEVTFVDNGLATAQVSKFAKDAIFNSTVTVGDLNAPTVQVTAKKASQ